MTLLEFQEKDLELQYTLTFTQGVFLHTIDYKNERVNLYSLYRFFVEIAYDRHNNEIIGLKYFEEGFLLGRYARSISADMMA